LAGGCCTLNAALLQLRWSDCSAGRTAFWRSTHRSP